MFKKAERKQIKLKLAVTGPTGSGKTFSALRLAKGLGGKIAVIDTENGSASLYSEQFEFDVLDLKPPFTVEKYIEAINGAEKAGYNTIVIDSLTHAWSGEGGLLEQKAQLDSRPGSNHWTNWGPIDKKDQMLKNAFLHSTCHVICTMRSKMEYAQTEDSGKKKVQKVGLAPIQRDGLTYDFTIVFDIAMDHQCDVSKDRTGLFADKIFKITEETGETINKWISTAAVSTILKVTIPTVIQRKEVGITDQEYPPQVEPIGPTDQEYQDSIVEHLEQRVPAKVRNEAPISMGNRKTIQDQLTLKNKTIDNFTTYVNKTYGVKTISEMKVWQFEEVMLFLK